MTALEIRDESERATALEKQALDLLPVLEARGAETEKLRRLPDATVADLRSAGLSRLCQPRKYGGAELSLDRAVRIVATVARGCASAGWICAIHSDHSILVNMFPAEVSEEIWGENPEAVISAGYFPVGRVERVSGGWKLSGKWGWVSGCDFADWILLGAFVSPGEPDPGHTFFLVPRSETEIEDNWHVMGLRGTGSKNVMVEGCFVPDRRTLRFTQASGGAEARGNDETRPLYRLPHVTAVPFFFNGVGLGIAESMLDAVTDQIANRESMGVKLAGQPTLQAGIAEAAAEIDCARLLIERDTSGTMAAMREGRSLTMQEKARNRRDHAYAGRLCKSAVGRLQGMAGAGAIFDGHVVERKFRDMHAVVNHIIQSWDIAATTFGEVTLGLKPTSPLI